jgi:L-threonylcarbamoyladenylate synthase
LAIIQAVGCGLVAPSANPFQKVSPTRAQDVRAYFSEEEVTVIDGGPCQVGIESTLIQLFPKKVVVIRKGMVTASMLANTLQDQKVDVLDAQGVQVAPGQDPNHYQPAVPLVLCKQSMSEAEVAQAVGQSLQLFHGQCIHLSDNADTAAREIYQQLRSAKPTTEYLWLDVSNIDAQQEKWQAILDRLHRAASLVIG